MRKKLPVSIYLMFVFVAAGITSIKPVHAQGASAVSIGTIDYEELTIQIYNNGNPIVFFSTDGSNWTEVEGAYDEVTKSYSMDISWISEKTDVTLYFKGNEVTKVVNVTIPKQDTDVSITYDRTEGAFNFEAGDDVDTFEWRKASNYNWRKVSMDYESASYRAFLDTIETFRVKGAKIILRIPQAKGSQSNAGRRPSKEFTISIIARAQAPTIKVNSSKLTLNTTSSMEYYDMISGTWMECTSTMSLEDIAPEVLYEYGGRNVALMIRKMATASAPNSETAYVTIKGQAAPPTIGDMSKDISYYYMNSKLAITFNNASKENAYEYAIVKPGASFNISSARWVTVTDSKLIYISNTSAPDGSTIYVRKKGVDANSAKKTELVLASEVNSIEVSY